MLVWDWITTFDDPKETLDSLLNGNKITDEACMNNAFYANARVQELFREADAQSNPRRRLEIFHEIERRIVDDVPWIFLVQFNTEMRGQPWLQGFSPRGFWPPVRLEKMWIER
jgi:oligopeptide transport system substrate-binding protein